MNFRSQLRDARWRFQSATHPPPSTNLPAASRSTTARKFLWYLSRAPFLASRRWARFSGRSYAAGELEFGAFYAETGAAPGTAPGDLQHGGV